MFRSVGSQYPARSPFRRSKSPARTTLVVACVLAVTAALSPSAVANFPPAGVDEFKSAAILEVDLTTIGGPILSITVVGPTRITRSDPFDPGDGKQMISTEIVSMVLQGGTPEIPITVLERGDRQSRGMIQQKTPDNWFPANSFFDVFIEAQTPLGVLMTRDPVRLFEMIDEIPPLQAQYQPDAAFIGVDLVDTNGFKVGVLRHAAHFVGQHPSFSVATGGSSTLSSAGLFDVPTTASPRIPALDLGISEADELDALSYGTDFTDLRSALMEVRFSVDPAALGLPGSDVNREATKTPKEAHGDEYWTTIPTFFRNVQELDEDGDTAPPFPLQISDDVDSLTEPPTPFVDPNRDGVPENPVYFSLISGSPSLGAMSGADILVTVGGSAPTVFIPFSDMGLMREDDIDALCLRLQNPDRVGDPATSVIFSLAPGSPTLALEGGSSAADIFFVSATGPGNPSPPALFAAASILGLVDESPGPDDNLNALKCTVVEEDYFHHSNIQFRLNDMPIDTWGHSHTRVAVGINGEAIESGSSDFVPQELVTLWLTEASPRGTPINVRTNSQQRSLGTINETNSATPGRLDVRPWGNGEARDTQNLFLEVDYSGQTLHNRQPICLHGIITEKPPAPFEPLEQFECAAGPPTSLIPETGGLWLDKLNSAREGLSIRKAGVGGPKEQSGPPIELFTEDGTPSGIFISDVVFVPNAPLPAPNVNPNGVVNAASFKLGSPPETIMSLFGTNLSEGIESNSGLPLPTELAGTSVTVTDSEGNEALAAVSTGPTNLSTLSSLFFVAPNQLNFFMPAGLAFGPATVTVMTEDGNLSSTTVAVVPCNPGLFAANDQGFGVAKANFVRGNTDGSQDRGLLFNPAGLQAVPVDLGPEGAVVFLELFGTGMRGCSSAATATLAGDAIPAFGPVAVPGFIGLDQANVGPISRDNVGAGEVEIVLTVDGIEANTVTVAIQ